MSTDTNVAMQDVASEIFTKLRSQIDERAARLPAATYRLQFHAGFPFSKACEIVPYLHELGISHCYASPFLKARPGSTHGYDIADHRLINPEVGSEQDFAAWADCLHAHGMGQILDMVPNHMGIGNENPWWQDVLENGPASQYSHYFDIAWQSSLRAELQNRVLIPILGDPYGKVLESGQLQIFYQDGAFSVHYFDHYFPLDPRSYDLILSQALPQLETQLTAEDLGLTEFRSILTAISHLPSQTETDLEKIAERVREKEVIKRRIATLVQENQQIREQLQTTIQQLNGESGNRETFNFLHNLLDRQAYRLSFWRVASDEINYRRFFDVNELAALNMEREEVFVATHDFVLRLLATDKIHGLRIDHPDGLYDPKQYLQWTQTHYLLSLAREIFESDPPENTHWNEVSPAVASHIGELVRERGPQFRPLYVVVEKILGGNEHLASDWSTHGTSGYDFLNMVNGMFVDTANAEKFTRLYADIIEDQAKFPEVAYRRKALILEASLSSELHMLAFQLDRLAQKDRWYRDFTFNGLRQALLEVIACFPVYRSYISDEGVSETDKLYVHTAVNRAIGRNPTISRSLFHFIRDMLLLKGRDYFGPEDQVDQRRFAGKFQQVTSPVAAKGIEDTAFYVYARLLSLNEVGGEPERFGISVDKLHRYCEDRQKNWSFSLSPLSTHDTKRSEDVRARLNALSEIPDEWRDCVNHWSEWNRVHRRCIDDAAVPDRNEEYFLYQTLLGAWPFEPMNGEAQQQFVARIQAYMTKALHEAKTHSSWINPNTDYDTAVCEFVARILDPANDKFLEHFTAFHQRIAWWGVLNSLAQTVLRIALPGVPDTYQGTELWDFSLVDPDNRRPIDYGLRRAMLSELKVRVKKSGGDRRPLAAQLLQKAVDGRIKLYVTWQALQARRQSPGLFTTGEYIPLEILGPKKEHTFAFTRRDADETAVVVVPRKIAGLCPESGSSPLGMDVWQSTALLLPNDSKPLRLRNVFTGEMLEPVEFEGGWSFQISHLLGHFPVAILVSEQP